VTSLQRSAVAPEVPTVAESGFPGFDALAWHGILAPAKTPPAIVKKLNAEIVSALKHPETQALGEAGDADGRQHAGGVRRLHPQRHRGLEGGRRRGGRFGEVKVGAAISAVVPAQAGTHRATRAAPRAHS
jgi:Tripartite tricarboxylate transporter family receptor